MVDLSAEKNAQKEWSRLSPQEKKRELYLRQKHTLDLFLERHAISQAQYEKSLNDLTTKMGTGHSIA
ncbi:MAG: hypothetical protein II038_05445 [Lachnospiraceae bacterium]|nr:hypothetical protein [Lachnospiraceae bacterium]